MQWVLRRGSYSTPVLLQGVTPERDCEGSVPCGQEAGPGSWLHGRPTQLAGRPSCTLPHARVHLYPAFPHLPPCLALQECEMRRGGCTLQLYRRGPQAQRNAVHGVTWILTKRLVRDQRAQTCETVGREPDKRTWELEQWGTGSHMYKQAQFA